MSPILPESRLAELDTWDDGERFWDGDTEEYHALIAQARAAIDLATALEQAEAIVAELAAALDLLANASNERVPDTGMSDRQSALLDAHLHAAAALARYYTGKP